MYSLQKKRGDKSVYVRTKCRLVGGHCCGVGKPNLWDSLQKETPAGGVDREAGSFYKLPAVEGSL